MATWLIWLLVATMLAIAEIFSVTGALGVLAAAALVAAVIAALGVPLPVVLLVFAASCIAGVVLIRPIVLRHVMQPDPTPFGVAALIGTCAAVVDEVTDQGGRIRLDGEVWTARAYDLTSVIPVGTLVDVMEIRGNTALVYPREESWISPLR